MGMPSLTFPDIPGQRGLATTRQLRAHGWTYSALSHLVATSGQRVLPRVYLPHRLTVPDDDLVVAGWLWAGDNTLLTGTRALARHGLTIPRPGPITRFLTQRDGRNREGNLGMELRRTRRLPTGLVRDEVGVVPIERALVDAARYKEASPRDLTGWTIAALQQRKTSPDRVDAEITASGWLGLTAVGQGVSAFRRGAWSVPEATLIDRITEDARFPHMVANCRLRDTSGRLIGRPDGYFPDEGVALQVHSQEFHTGRTPDGRDRWSLTVEGDGHYTQYGIVVVGVTPQTLANGPDAFLEGLLLTLAANRGRRPAGVLIEGEDW